jgi:peptide/nickel transport system substrate-binding protein
MYTFTMGQPDPQRFMDRYVSWEIASKANSWQRRNHSRYRNDQYDRLFREAGQELDPVRRAALFIRLNDLLVGDRFMIPLLFRPDADAVAHKLVVSLSGWTNALSAIARWYRDA